MEALASICTACGHGLEALDDRHASIEEFHLVGEYWTIRFEGQTCNVRDGKGLGYIAELLRAPGRPVHTLDLVANHQSEDDCSHGDCDGDAYAALERARLSATRAIRRAQARIATCHPSLGRHLDTTIRTGTYCAYVPDSRVPITWDVGLVSQRDPVALRTGGGTGAGGVRVPGVAGATCARRAAPGEARRGRLDG